jgi:methylated-DNA-[protein]-cysteine S-methyltransferase
MGLHSSITRKCFKVFVIEYFMQKSFNERCYEQLKKVPRGAVTTYSAIAKALGSKAYRAVGTAMKKNPHKDAPCHRVVSSDGSIGGYNGGVAMKIKRLKEEGVVVKDGRVVNFRMIYFDLF